MKQYVCDACGSIIDIDNGMVEGWWKGNRKIAWKNPDGSEQKLIVVKTLKLYIDKDADQKEVESKKDLCRGCIVRLEKA